MTSNPPFPLHPADPPPQIASVTPASMHFPYPGAYTGNGGHGGGYNVDWGPQDHLLLHLASQLPAGQPSTAGASATTTNSGCHCRWLSGGILCGQDCTNFDELIIHLGRVHDVQGPAGRRLACHWLTPVGICGKLCRRDAYRRHIATHLSHSVSCDECGKTFSRGDTLRGHRKKVHGNQ